MSKPERKLSGTSARNKILEVSTGLFANQGFEGVTMRQIASASEITMPAIYHHFGNKEDLFKEVERVVYTKHADRLLSELQAEGSAEERLRNFVYALYETLETNHDYAKLLQRNLVEGWEENQRFLVDLSLQKVLNALKKHLIDYNKLLRDSVAPIAVFSFIVGFLSLRPLVAHTEGFDLLKASTEERCKLVVDTVMQYLSNAR